MPTPPGSKRMWGRLALLVLTLVVDAAWPGVTSAQATDEDPRVTALVQRGEAHLEAGASRRAARRFRDALRRSPNHQGAMLGFCRASLPSVVDAPPRPTRAIVRRIAEVRDLLSRAEATGDTEAPAFTRVRSWLLALEGDHRGAIHMMVRRSQDYDPEAAAWLDALALLAVRRHDEIAADQAVTAARVLEPTLERAISHADLRMARGQAQAAVAILRQASQMAPGDARVARRHAEALMAAGRPREAAAAAEGALETCAGPCHELVVRALLQAQDPTAAGEAALRADAHFGPSSPEGPYLRALVALARAQTDEAAALLDEALQRDGAHAGARQARRALTPR